MSVPLRVRRARSFDSRNRSLSRSPSPPPKRSPRKKHRSHHEGYALPRKGASHRRSEIEFLLCIYHTSSHSWSTEPFRFDPQRVNDRELWLDVRNVFRTDLQKPWRRLLGFKRVKTIQPCTFTHNGVPTPADDKDVELPDPKAFSHAYHHPERIRPDHLWVDWFVEFDRSSPGETKGLEFKEGLWAEKLVIVAVLCTIAIITVSIVWCALGGNLQTVFTVMGFVLSLIAAQIALAALYYQVSMPN